MCKIVTVYVLAWILVKGEQNGSNSNQNKDAMDLNQNKIERQAKIVCGLESNE